MISSDFLRLYFYFSLAIALFSAISNYSSSFKIDPLSIELYVIIALFMNPFKLLRALSDYVSN
jgi:hypothetical protein